jgi:hypothetical protein
MSRDGGYFNFKTDRTKSSFDEFTKREANRGISEEIVRLRYETYSEYWDEEHGKERAG